MALVATKSIIVTIGLLFVFFIHELGHYLVGRMFQLKIAEFSVGIGPVKFLPRFLDNQGTTWRLGLLPVGGYVRPLQKPTEELSAIYEAASEVESRFTKMIKTLFKPFRKFGKFLVDKPNDDKVKGKKYIDDLSPIESVIFATAGPGFNFLLSMTGLCILYSFYGCECVEIQMTKNSEGLIVGDRITRMNNTPLTKVLSYRLFPERGTATIKREDKTVLLEIHGIDKQSSELVVLPRLRLDIGSAIKHSILHVSFLIKENFLRLINLGQTLPRLRGPVSVIKDGIQFTSDFYTFIAWILIVSILLGTFNLLPIPPLDGGRIVLGLLELCSPKSYHESIQKIFNDVALMVVLLLFALIFKSDIIGFRK